jgi:acyl-CoA synthetase (AMP-forming)/AMP-acid ligase II
MRIDQRLALLRSAGEDALFSVRTVGRVARKTGMHRAIHWSGVKFALGEALRGAKSDASFLFRFMAHNDPHRVGIVGVVSPEGGRVTEERAYSFFEMSERVERIAAGLAERGIRQGDRIIVMVKNRPDFVLVQIAAGRLGASAVSCSYRATPRELEYIAENSGARALFFDVDVAPAVREAAPVIASIGRDACFSVGGVADPFPSIEGLVATSKGEVPPADTDPAVVMYTSGTTGKPKGAVRRFAKNSAAAALAVMGETTVETGEVHLVVCPLYHATASGFLTMSYLVGCTAIVLREFRPEAFLEAIERYRVTTTAVVPTMLHRIVELGEDVVRRYDTSSLKVIFSGGAPLSGPLALEVMRLFGDKLYNFYGATETGVVTLAKPEDLRAAPGTIGRAVPGAHVRLYDESGRICRPGEVGELYARSGQMIEGYHADAEGTREAMRDGFFSVGDLARMDERGYFFIEGRKRDMIISGGMNVYPAEVEAVLHDHPAVAEVAVVGVADVEWGERVRAFVSLKLGASAGAKELEMFCRTRLSGAKVPRDIVFLPSLPRNPTGKILKRELRAMQPPEPRGPV